MLTNTNIAAEDIYKGFGLDYKIWEIPPFFSSEERAHENTFVLFQC